MPRKINYPTIPEDSILRLELYLNSPLVSYKDARNKLIISLFYYQGIKTSIAQRLTYENYDIKNNLLTFPLDNKLSGYLSILPEDTTKKILIYIQKFKISNKQRLIRNVDYKKDTAGLPITVRSLQRIIKELSEELDLPKIINPRSLRHLCAVRLTQENLQHKSIDHLIGRVSPWVFTEYKRLAGNFRKHGSL